MSWITNYFWPPEVKPMRADDAAHAPEIRDHFVRMLDNTDPPNVFSPKKVAQELSISELSKLGYKDWGDAIPAIYELTWELRAIGDLVIIYKGKVLPEDVDYHELEGPIKIMRNDNGQ